LSAQVAPKLFRTSTIRKRGIMSGFNYRFFEANERLKF